MLDPSLALSERLLQETGWKIQTPFSLLSGLGLTLFLSLLLFARHAVELHLGVRESAIIMSLQHTRQLLLPTKAWRLVQTPRASVASEVVAAGSRPYNTAVGASSSKRVSTLNSASGHHRGSRQLVRASPLPTSAAEQIAVATGALRAAMANNQKQLRVELLLPKDEKEQDFMATEPVDYPIEVQEEFRLACNEAQSVLVGLNASEALSETQFQSQRIDDKQEGEPVAQIWGPGVPRGVVFPTADVLGKLRTLVERYGDAEGLVLFNPQWNEGGGNFISDFGFGPWREKNQKLVDSFQVVYSQRERRIGAPSSMDAITGQRGSLGGVIRVVYAYPAEWTVYQITPKGWQRVADLDHNPTYEECDDLLKGARKEHPEWFEFEKLEETDQVNTQDAGLTKEAILKMDKAQLQRSLLAYGKPTSGKMDSLRQRLLEFIDAE